MMEDDAGRVPDKKSDASHAALNKFYREIASDQVFTPPKERTSLPNALERENERLRAELATAQKKIERLESEAAEMCGRDISDARGDWSGLVRTKSESWGAKQQRLGCWHEWFAWRPVRVGERIVWLERIERQGFFRRCGEMEGRWEYQYREGAGEQCSAMNAA